MLRIEGQSNIGKVRSENQDAIFWSSDRETDTSLLILADGMGGYSGGAYAAQTVVKVIQRETETLFQDHIPVTIGDAIAHISSVVRSAIQIANSELWKEKQSSNPEYDSMGTTIVVAAEYQQHLIIAHVGDSRAYLFKADTFNQLTQDHSVIEDMIKSQQIKASEAKDLGIQDALTKAIGIEEFVEPDLQHIELDSDDLLLLCSDGLNKHLTNLEIGTTLAEPLPIRLLVNKLMESTLERGAKDNVSILLAQPS